MKRPHLPLGAWIAGGLIAAALVVPGISYAAGAVTQIAGKNGTTVANVTAAGQLQTTEAGPAGFFTQVAETLDESTGTCRTFYTTPATRGLVIRDIRSLVVHADSGDGITLWAGSDCDGAPFAIIGGDSKGNVTTPITPGFSIPADTTISFSVADASQQLEMIFWVDGYYVPKGNPLTHPLVVKPLRIPSS
jgi:hypothetical protein